MPDENDQPITRAVLRDELTAFAQNLTPAFRAVESHIEERIEASETKLLGEMHRVEQRLDAKIDGVEQRLDAKIDGVEQRLDAKIDGVEARLTQRIEVTAVSFRKLETNVASLTRRVEDIERKLNPPPAH